jgi:hypothetical protein
MVQVNEESDVSMTQRQRICVAAGVRRTLVEVAFVSGFRFLVRLHSLIVRIQVTLALRFSIVPSSRQASHVQVFILLHSKHWWLIA